MRRILGALALVLAAAGAPAAGRADDETERLLQQSRDYLKQGDIMQALAAVNAAIAHEPGYAPAYLRRGELWWSGNNFAKARDDYSQAMALGLDRSPYVYTQRGDANAAAGDYPQAIADYERALALNPAFWPALAGRGGARVESGDTAAGIADIERALAQDPGTVTEVLQVGKGAGQAGADSAKVTMETGRTIALLHLARAKVRYSQGAYAPALADLDETIKRMPNLIAAHFFHALSLLALGRCQEGAAEIHAPTMPSMTPFPESLAQYHDAAAKGGCAVD
jgi:tetratricopeptide (TPR) repeat protein